jgi:hypothetical protein
VKSIPISDNEDAMHIPEGLKPHFKALSVLGVLLMAGDTWLSFKFGSTISWEMAIIVAAISIASGFLLVVALYFHKAGIKNLGRGLAVAWVMAFAFNVWSNMGVSTANRMGEVQQASLQKATYEGRQNKIEESERSLKVFEANLARLLEDNAWAASVTADGLRAQSATLDRAIAQEGDKRNGGCRRKCIELMNQKAAVDKQIAVAEQRSDLTNRIEANKQVLAKLRADLAQTDGGISATANQSTLYAKLISWNLAADPNADMVTVANESTGIASAIVLALLAAVVTLAAAWPTLMHVTPITGTLAPTQGEPTSHTSAAPSYNLPAVIQGISTTTIAQMRQRAALA